MSLDFSMLLILQGFETLRLPRGNARLINLASVYYGNWSGIVVLVSHMHKPTRPPG